MKNLLTVVMLFVFSTALYAQKDVTKFLGIPVDGTKTAMIQKLKAKGFQYNSSGDYLTGEFNGRDVRISVVTNNNKVYRIMVVDDNNSDETSIKIHFADNSKTTKNIYHSVITHYPKKKIYPMK